MIYFPTKYKHPMSSYIITGNIRSILHEARLKKIVRYWESNHGHPNKARLTEDRSNPSNGSTAFTIDTSSI